MPLVVRPLEPADISESVRLRVACLGTLVIGRLPPYKGFFEHAEASTHNELVNCPHVHHFKVIDTENEGEIIACAKWEVYEHGRSDTEKLLQHYQKEHKEVDGFEDLREAAHQYFGKSNAEIGKKPHLLLALLVTAEEHRCKGAGSLLIDWGISKSETLGLPCYLHASEEGRSLYERHGFRVLSETQFHLCEYGLEGTAVMTEMLREPSTGATGKADGRFWPGKRCPIP